MNYKGIDPESGQAVELEVEGGRVKTLRPLKTDEANLPYLCHGFLDMQVNGYEGSDYSLENFERRHIENIIRRLAAAGTTQHVPTIITRPQELIVKNLRVISRARREAPLIDAAIAGIHIEGPYISHEDGPRGAHDPRYLRDPDYEEFLRWQEAAEGQIKIVTLAPEREGALSFIEKITKQGVVAAIGHTAASPERIREAIAAGASLSTHLGNGSHASLPRLKNYIWEQLAADGLWAGLIADSFHLPEAVVKVIAKVKGLDRLILVSDVSLPGGYRPGLYKWGNLDVQVFDDGHVGLAGTGFLAGAGHLLDWDIPVFMRFTGASLAETIRLCTVNPARLLGIPSLCEVQAGSLAVGAGAHLTLFRFKAGDKRLEVLETVIGGEPVGV